MRAAASFDYQFQLPYNKHKATHLIISGPGQKYYISSYLISAADHKCAPGSGNPLHHPRDGSYTDATFSRTDEVCNSRPPHQGASSIQPPFLEASLKMQHTFLDIFLDDHLKWSPLTEVANSEVSWSVQLVNVRLLYPVYERPFELANPYTGVRNSDSQSTYLPLVSHVCFISKSHHYALI